MEMTYIKAINSAMFEEMRRDENVFVMGEDVAELGCAFKATEGLLEAFGEERVIVSPVAGTTRDTLVLAYNDVPGLTEAFAEHGGRIAGVIVEPVVGNMGTVIPTSEFRQRLRSLTAQHGALLIFDEVMTGFRVAYGGAQSLFGITPDLTTLGKIVGGGLPVGAYGGRADVMRHVLPAGQVFQAGTLSGGEQQMLALARAFMQRPRLLLLDEPSLGLAPKLVTEIFRIIKDLNDEGLTVLVVEQNAHIALQLAQNAYVLEVGRVALSGPSAELQEHPSVRRSYLGY